MHEHTAQNATTLWNWFSGGATQYMKLTHCMNQDWPWIFLTVGLDLAVGVGYALIALHWWRNQRNLAPGPAKSALGSLKNIFIFCACCGYIFIPLKMFWPAWRLYDLFMAVLVYFTWKYAWGARQLKVLYTELGRTEKLASDLEASREETKRKRFFLNAVSHDLRTPLNGLSLQADLAQIHAETGDIDALKDALSEIKASARATAELLNSFLELGKLDWSHDPNNLSEFDLRGCLEHLFHTYQLQAEQKGLYVRIVAPPTLPIRTDRVKLERILGNLLTNAVKFTQRGGVTLTAEPNGPDLRIEVADTGDGISPADQEQLFQEFYQVRNDERDRRKGFGLGLAISQRLAQQLGADLGVESEVGHGSRFRVHLRNVCVAHAAAPEPRRPSEPSAVLAG